MLEEHPVLGEACRQRGRGAGGCCSVCRTSPVWDAGTARSWLLSCSVLSLVPALPRWDMRGIGMGEEHGAGIVGRRGWAWHRATRACWKLPLPFPSLEFMAEGPEAAWAALWAQGCGASLVTALGSSPALHFCLKRKLVPESRRIKTGFKSYGLGYKCSFVYFVLVSQNFVMYFQDT